MKKSKWQLFLMVVLMMSLVVFVGCSNQNTGSNDADEEEQVNIANNGDQKTIGMIVKHANTEYIQAFIIGAKDAAEELGINLLITDAQADTMRIMNAIDTFIVQGIDGFILAGAEDLVALVPGIEKLNEEGIPVFALDTSPEGGYVDMFITFDIVKSSEKAAEQMIQGMKEANGGVVPAGIVMEITGSLVDMFAAECHTGFTNIMKQYPQLTLVQGEGNWNNDDSYNRASDLLTRYGDEVVGIYVHTPDIMGAGVVAAVENAGKNPGDYFISGICLGKEGLDLVKQGKLYAVVEQPALVSAEKAVRYMNDVFNGVEIPNIGETIEEEGAMWSPATVVENEYADGGRMMILQAPLVPQEVSPEDLQLWENRI
ncbi:ribose ABC transport system substrate binding protein RbsB [Clostridium aceticum]|uniref:Ribose ABC transport system substrate binding protein RbsB n=1 Tax=Clostridium aceticum TaxID=84022 RepID=A0A0D8IBN0_9CLOT|nr:sugar ABC transporter substrate-binding protein [Clostridium aceticum]AKL94755.1 ribose ABC transport system substrate binding protein RbsB [Clostridium aceticum]KJF27703.1 sugar ABC transporter substrate-binding protein [Clostridium aceticum]